jgi:Ca2+-binding EF-hand superfamily protein
MSYDRLCDGTEEWSFLNFHKEIFKKPNPNWHFDRVELHSIAVIYFKLQLDAGCALDRDLPSKSFSNVLHKAFGIVDDSMVARIFKALDSTESVSLSKWLSITSIFLRGSLQEKIDFCFKVYDISGNEKIRLEHMVKLLRKFVFKHRDEEVAESVKDLADIIVKKMDLDEDGAISFADFSTAVHRDPMLLECFGQCLPDRIHAIAFLTTFTDKIKL